jgi:cell division protein FtsA
VIDETGFAEMLGAGVVLTGGTTMLDGMPELAERVLELPVRRGSPTGVGGLVDVVKSPSYSTGVGLVKYGAQKLRARPAAPVVVEPQVVAASPASGWGRRLGAWFREVF